MDVQASGRDDHIFLAATEAQIAFRIQFAKITCAQPTFLTGRLQCSGLPIACGDVFTSHEDFAIFRQPEFAARKNLADGALRRTKRMIEADQRCRLRHAVTLDNGISHALEKILRLTRQRRASGKESPELPAEPAMDAAKHPGAAKKFPVFCLFKGASQPWRFLARREVPLDSGAQQVQHARYCDQRRGALAPDRSNDFRGIRRGFENHGGAEERRNEQRQELPEDMAQRNECYETQRVKPALIFSIGLDAALEGLEVR